MRPLIPVMRHARMRSRGSLPPTPGVPAIRSPGRHIAILIQRGLAGADSGRIRRIRSSDVGGCGMGRECVGVLLVQGVVALLLALPELAFGGTGGVAVVGGGAEGTLFAAVADEAVFGEDGEEEEDAVGLH